MSPARPTRVAINGFGRIGRAVLRILSDREDVDVVAVNDITDDDTLVYLLKYDTVHGVLRSEVGYTDGVLTAGRQRARMLAERDPGELPWGELEVDVVVEATGRFRKRDEIARHLDAGAGRVVLTVPAKDRIDYTCVLGVNDEGLAADQRIVSNASCTTNCLAPVAKVLHESFGVERGWVTTVHAYTNDQRLKDYVHRDLRRSRAAAENIIPTTTGAARAVGQVLPALDGKLDGMAMRVPIPDGSTIDLVVELAESPTAEAINDAFRAAANGPLEGIVEYNDAPIVSSDILGNPASAIFDAPLTRSSPATARGASGRMAKIVAWYDNEWGYSCRVVDLVARLARFGPPSAS